MDEPSKQTVEELLSQWGFAKLQKVFKENQIDYDSLLLLKPGSRNIETLIPVMGERLKFENILEEWQSRTRAIKENDSLHETREVNGKVLTDAPAGLAYDIPSMTTDPQYSMTLDSIELYPILGQLENGTESLTQGNNSLVTIQEYLTVRDSVDEKKMEFIHQGKEADFPSADDTRQDIEVEEEFIDPIELVASIRALDFKKFLSETQPGLAVLTYYDANKTLDSTTRRLLGIAVSSNLAKAITKKSKPLQLQNIHYNELAKKTASLFNENPLLYYTPPCYEGGHQKISKGLYVDRFRNDRRGELALGLAKRRKIKTEKKETTVHISDCLDEMNHERIEQGKPHAEVLKHDTSDWNKVLEHWDISYDYRKHQLKTFAKGGVDIIFREWPVLRQPQGYELIELDYARRFPGNRHLALFAAWPEFARKIYDVMKTEIKDRSFRQQLLSIDIENISPEKKAAQLLKLLPALCPPTMRKRVGSKNMKPTITEALNSFILEVKTPTELEPSIQRQRDLMTSWKLTLQPFVIFMGSAATSDPLAYYVCIDNVTYRLESPLKAIDICFKSFFVLNAEYPKICEPVWILIQKCLYGIPTKQVVNRVEAIEVAIKNVV